MENVIEKILEMRKKDILKRGFNFGFEIPKKRMRSVNVFMAQKGVILEIKRASPSKGNISPNLNAAETAKKYRESGAAAISCLTEENFFKGNLKDLIEVCNTVQDVAVLRKDFLIDEKEIEIAFLCGADAVLLISGILTLEKMLSMTKKCADLGIRAFCEVRTLEDVKKVLEVKKIYPKTVVCGVNSRNLRDFSIDLLVPAMLKKTLGNDVIFESGITTAESAKKVASMGFSGILLGEFAAKNPKKADEFVKAFKNQTENLYGKKLIELAEKLNLPPRRFVMLEPLKSSLSQQSQISKISKKFNPPLVKICGLTRTEDVLLADSLGADFLGFIFAREFSRNVYGEKFTQIQKILPKLRAFKVAVITNPNGEEAKFASELVQKGILDFIQIHGIFYDEVPENLKNLPHYFALTEKMGNLTELSQKLTSYGEVRFLQDSKNHNYGTKEHLWLAGGLNPENVCELCKKFHPELVDISSGLEDKIPGEKNPEKMKKFFASLSI